MLRKARVVAGLLASVIVVSCGGGGDGGPSSAGTLNAGTSNAGTSSTGTSQTQTGSNVTPAVVGPGPDGNSVNTLYVSVTVCVPGSTTNCQTLDNVEVDTGSYGLRILSSALTVALPIETVSGGASLAECANFVQGYSWGPVATADLQIGGESAASLPVQIVGDANFTSVPQDCSGLGTAVDTVSAFGANAILGVGTLPEDCGPGCAASAVAQAYYACLGTAACTATAVPVSAQVKNPVSAFATDNNGVIVQLPAVPTAGAASPSGYLIFGIDTQTNNASGSETVLTLDANGYISVNFNGMTLSDSFIDSGTNGIFFNAGSNSNLPVCSNSNLMDFYCPAATEEFNATLTGANGTTASVQFSIANTQTLLSGSATLTAFADLGGTYPGTTSSFDFGLPFFYGRRVASAIDGMTTAVGTGPYIAF